MTDIAIRCEGLAKQYRIGERDSYRTLRDAISDVFTSPFRRLHSAARDSSNGREELNFWALKDVSFEIKRGEVLGIIGRNGAGKSTLLKILSRITEPSRGHVDIWGRVGSLLEVGTGFHPELTGRDNIFLNGAILGMRRAEIARKFDEIVAFAEVEKFIDTPVKRYSSGMYVRLAFAVAAHLEPEILLVDEVLAVGDITFQKRCLGKIGDIASSGRTVVLVSHTMAAINALSSRVVLLKDGEIEIDGSASEVTARYYSESLNLPENDQDLLNRPRQGNGKASFSSITIQAINRSGQPIEFAYPACDLSLDVELECYRDFVDCILAAIIYDSNGYRLIDTNTAQKGEYVSMTAGQKGRANFLLREVLLKPGRYFVRLWLGRHAMEVLDDVEHAVAFDVVESEETSQHVIIYPGVYLCRFENTFSVSV